MYKYVNKKAFYHEKMQVAGINIRNILNYATK